MAWIIDRDYMPDPGAPEGTNANAKGVMGPCNAPEQLCRSATHNFRMLTDDDEVLYAGRSTEADVFDPLDDFGTPNAGCTKIQYRHLHGEWETL